MSIFEEPESDEPIIISLEAYREANSRPEDRPPPPVDQRDPKAEEAYWAGRNHAMRRSALGRISCGPHKLQVRESRGYCCAEDAVKALELLIQTVFLRST